ncbi:MAG: hypothetical protein ACLTS6_12190 [Anaerobutyricum sp.]
MFKEAKEEIKESRKFSGNITVKLNICRINPPRKEDVNYCCFCTPIKRGKTRSANDDKNVDEKNETVCCSKLPLQARSNLVTCKTVVKVLAERARGCRA